MSGTYKGLLLTFDRDISEERANELSAILSVIGGVASVRPLIDEHVDVMARDRVRSEIRKAFLEFWKTL